MNTTARSLVLIRSESCDGKVNWGLWPLSLCSERTDPQRKLVVEVDRLRTIAQQAVQSQQSKLHAISKAAYASFPGSFVVGRKPVDRLL